MKDSIIEKLKGKHIAILGFGKEGQSTFQFILDNLPNNKVTIIDKNDVSSSIVPNENVNVVYGDNYLDNLAQYDLIFKTPGISFVDVDTSGFKDKITSQMELFLEYNRKNVIGITGTKGKSTTSSLICSILKENGVDVVLAGNIGVPVFDFLDEKYNKTTFVLEMSSHQLEFLKCSPHIALVLNLFQDHLDHAGSVSAYFNAKMNIFAFQDETDYMVYFADNDNLTSIISSANFLAEKYAVSIHDQGDIYLKDGIVYSNNEEVFSYDIPRNLLGDHNFINIMFAYKVSELLGLNKEKTLNAISSFKPLKYRMEMIGEVNSVKYYVDTLATIPEATLETINSLPNIETLIFGGMDRGISYDNFAKRLMSSQVKNFICMPETGHKIGKELFGVHTYFVDTIEEAVAKAKEVTTPGMGCVLSPAAASYSHFKNYQDKAERYKELVLKDK